jgi:hypothetical protein
MTLAKAIQIGLNADRYYGATLQEAWTVLANVPVQTRETLAAQGNVEGALRRLERAA